MFSWCVETGWLDASPILRVKRLRGGNLPAWTEADAALALRHLKEPLRRAVVLALFTGQRRGDLTRLTWNAYDGRAIRLRQGKTGAELVIPCHPELKAELDAWRPTTVSPLILVNSKGKPWLPTNLSTQLGRALEEIEGFPSGRNIHGLRKLAATNLAQAGCSMHEIAAITGHKTLAMVQLYTASVDQERLAEAAVIRLSSRRPSNV
jgi:integrase